MNRPNIDWTFVFERLNTLQERYPFLGIRILFRPDGSGHIYGLTDLANHPLFDFADFQGLMHTLTQLWQEALAAFDQRYKLQEGKDAKPK